MPGSRATKAGNLRTLVCLAEVAGFELFPQTTEKFESRARGHETGWVQVGQALAHSAGAPCQW